jgi:hypothetical protein
MALAAFHALQRCIQKKGLKWVSELIALEDTGNWNDAAESTCYSTQIWKWPPQKLQSVSHVGRHARILLEGLKKPTEYIMIASAPSENRQQLSYRNSNLLGLILNPKVHCYCQVFTVVTTFGHQTVTCRGVRVTDIVSSRFDWLDLLGVSITISLDYNSSHIWLLLDNESFTVVWILH